MKARVFKLMAALLVALVAAQGIGARHVYAQTVSMASTFQVLNLSKTNVASIQVTYYDQNGNLAPMATGYVNPDNDTVQPGQSNTYNPIRAASGFNGSVVISSGEQIAVVSNLTVNTTAIGLGSYVGVAAGSPKLYFPVLQRSNNSNNSTFNVQNTTSGADVTIQINFVGQPGKGFSTIAPVSKTIKPGAANTFNLATMTEFASAGKWIGSATVTVTAPAGGTVAGVANTIRSSNAAAYELQTYNAFGSGSTTVIAPLVQENNNLNSSTINCQNLDPTTTTTITANYTPGPGFPAKAAESAPGIVPNGGATFFQLVTTNNVPPRFIGSATITSSPAVPLACVINQARRVSGRTSSYEGFDPSKATSTVVIPLVQSRNGNATNGYVSSTINVSTVDGSSTTFKVDYQPAPGFADPADVITAPGSSATPSQVDVFGTGARFIGGAIVTSLDGKPIVAIVNQGRSGGPYPVRDTLSTYDAFNN